jgi:hypothetical protein
MSDDVTASQILESQLREARAEAAGYRAHNEALQLQVAELNGELAAAERAAFADVAEIGRTLAVLRHAGINAEWVDGEMLSKISPAEGVEHLAARCELFRQLLEAAPHWSTSHEGMSKWHVRVSEALVTALANARKAVAP